jgi:hypothetical protein
VMTSHDSLDLAYLCFFTDVQQPTTSYCRHKRKEYSHVTSVLLVYYVRKEPPGVVLPWLELPHKRLAN